MNRQLSIWPLLPMILFLSISSCQQNEIKKNDLEESSNSTGLHFDAKRAVRDIARKKVKYVYYDIHPYFTLYLKCDSIAKKYGFSLTFRVSEGYNEEEVKGVREYNEIILKYLEKINGKDWYKKFNAETKLIMKNDVDIITR